MGGAGVRAARREAPRPVPDGGADVEAGMAQAAGPAAEHRRCIAPGKIVAECGGG